MSSESGCFSVATALGARPPSGSSILRFTLAWFFNPTIRTKFLIALAVDPSLPMIWPMSSGFTFNESNTPISQSRLATLLGVDVTSPAVYHSNSHFSLTSADINSLKDDASQFAATALYIDPTKIDISRLALIRILNPDLTNDRREYLIRDLTGAAYAQMHLVHLGPGKFTVTSTHQDLPITLTNGFPLDVKVNLYVIPTNLKVEVGTLPQVVIPAKSKIQVMVPITVLTSGTSGLNVELTSTHGNLLGDSVIYPLQLSVISPIATWFTTGAAIVLFVAATFQSIRRIRRRQR